MPASFTTVEEYIDNIPSDKLDAFNALRDTIIKSLPTGFQECISYGMIGYVVPHDLYPNGYHCNPKLPLPFASIAAQKNCITVYHMGIYANSELLDRFTQEFPKYSNQKLDIGKGCIRFKKWDEIPMPLIEKLFTIITVQDWITIYESEYKR